MLLKYQLWLHILDEEPTPKEILWKNPVISLLQLNGIASTSRAAPHSADWWNQGAPVVCFEAPSVRRSEWCIAANLHQAAASAEPYFAWISSRYFTKAFSAGFITPASMQMIFFSSRWSISHQLNAEQRNVFYLNKTQKRELSERWEALQMNDRFFKDKLTRVLWLG